MWTHQPGTCLWLFEINWFLLILRCVLRRVLKTFFCKQKTSYFKTTNSASENQKMTLFVCHFAKTNEILCLFLQQCHRLIGSRITAQTPYCNYMLTHWYHCSKTVNRSHRLLLSKWLKLAVGNVFVIQIIRATVLLILGPLTLRDIRWHGSSSNPTPDVTVTLIYFLIITS